MSLAAARRHRALGAYDIRGLVPDELDETLAYRVGRALVRCLGAGRYALGRDMRPSSEALARALASGICAQGGDCLDLGLAATEEVYYAVLQQRLRGGVMVTASHNPLPYNGFKIVGAAAMPLDRHGGLGALREAIWQDGPPASNRGRLQRGSVRGAYVDYLLDQVDVQKLAGMQVVAECGFGMAGPLVGELGARVPFTLIGLRDEPDSGLPMGIPNPMLQEQQDRVAETARRYGGQLTLAFDGDGDRCFFFDEHGIMVDGYYVLGLLIAACTMPGETVVLERRLLWHSLDVASRRGVRVVLSKAGHGFIKAAMRRHGATYGGEMSGHHFFRSFGFCDSGMLPWLRVLQAMQQQGLSLGALVRMAKAAFPISGERNRPIHGDSLAVLQAVQRALQPEALETDWTDGLSMTFAQWRFNLRPSNTEPLLRLNVETRGDPELLQDKVALLDALLEEGGGAGAQCPQARVCHG